MPFGPTDRPYVENPIANWIRKVHWGDDGPGPFPTGEAFALVVDPALVGQIFVGTWDAVNTTSGGSANMRYPPGSPLGQTYVTLDLISWSPPNIFGVAPPKFIGIGQGESWSFTLSMTHGFYPPPIGPNSGSRTITARIVRVNLTDSSPGETILQISATAEAPGGSETASASASGTVPLPP